MTQTKNTSKKIPQVLIRAKENVEAKRAAEAMNNSSYDKSSYDKSTYEKGPWDKGHWANRK